MKRWENTWKPFGTLESVSLIMYYSVVCSTTEGGFSHSFPAFLPHVAALHHVPDQQANSASTIITLLPSPSPLLTTACVQSRGGTGLSQTFPAASCWCQAVEAHLHLPAGITLLSLFPPRVLPCHTRLPLGFPTHYLLPLLLYKALTSLRIMKLFFRAGYI